MVFLHKKVGSFVSRYHRICKTDFATIFSPTSETAPSFREKLPFELRNLDNVIKPDPEISREYSYLCLSGSIVYHRLPTSSFSYLLAQER